MMVESFLKEFKKNCCYRLDEGQRMIHIALAKVAENDLWKLPADNGMALGNQLLHCSGNMTQYIISSLGENVDKRERDLEFLTDRGFNKIELFISIKGFGFEVVKGFNLLPYPAHNINAVFIVIFYILSV